MRSLCISLALLAAAGLAAADDATPSNDDGLATALLGLDLPPQLDAALVLGDDVCGLVRGAPVDYRRFHAASITKLFTATAVFSMQQDGKLAIDDPVGNYVAEFADSPITIEQLLTHTSGLRDTERAGTRSSREDVNRYIATLAKQRTDGLAGVQWRYADAGYNLLGRAIEEIAGRPYADVIDDRVLRPLGMRNSTYSLYRVPDEDRVVAYDKRGRAERHPWDRAFLPSSGLQTTAPDLALFAKAMLDIAGGATGGILEPGTLRQMLAVQHPTRWNGVEQAFGWQIAATPDGRQWRHAGGEAGFESLLTLYPEHDIAIALLGNQEDWPRFELERRLRRWALDGDGGGCY